MTGAFCRRLDIAADTGYQAICSTTHKDVHTLSIPVTSLDVSILRVSCL